MATIEVYTKFLCPYCSRAKALLDGKGASYREIDVTMDRAGFDAMVARAGGRRTVPQIFVDGGHRSEEHTSELQSLMRISYAVVCLKKTNAYNRHTYICTTHAVIT